MVWHGMVWYCAVPFYSALFLSMRHDQTQGMDGTFFSRDGGGGAQTGCVFVGRYGFDYGFWRCYCFDMTSRSRGSFQSRNMGS